MRGSMEFQGPTSGPAGRNRAAESRKEAKSIARQIVLLMVSAGWRESEAALSLADICEDYCLHLVEDRSKSLCPANSNTGRVAS